MVLDDDLIEIMEKNPEERTPEERQAYVKYLEGVWKMTKKTTPKTAEEGINNGT